MKKMIITGIVTVGVLLGGTTLVGAAMDKVDDKGNVQEAVVKSEVVETKDVATTKDILPIEKVKSIALSKFEGHIEDIDLEHENGYAYYEVDIENGDEDYEIHIDAFTGELLVSEFDDDEAAKKRKALENLLSADEAKKIAVDLLGGKVVEIELDEDDSRYEFELEVMTDRGEVDLTIDAITGEVLEQELDD